MSLRIEQAQDAVFERGAEANVFNSLRSPHARVIPSNVRLAGEKGFLLCGFPLQGARTCKFP